MQKEEVDRASRSLNDIYIHALGVLDNYAHAIGAQMALERFTKLVPMKKTLFSREFLACCESPSLRSLTEPFQTWASALKQLRNPVAHGIPLTVPPAFLNEETRPAYVEASKAYYETLNDPPLADGPNGERTFAEWRERVQTLEARMDSIGEFHPVIVHDPRANVVPIYPTVLDDAGKLVVLCRGLNQFIADGASAEGETRSS